MRFCSTRDKNNLKSAHEVILEGIAPDGGLYVPCSVPAVDVRDMLALTYAQRAKLVFSKFLDDYTEEELESVVDGAYANGRFDEEGVAPLAQLNDSLFVMELFHGPTLAFKDVALQAMPRLLPLAAKKSGNETEVLILVATSGDTGKAALEGFRDVPGTRIIVFYPAHGVSRAQYLQMATQQGENTHVVAVEGNFDDCQRGVKVLFGDRGFEKEMDALGISLSSANSINWARLMPQIVYYFSSYADLVNEEKIELGDEVNFIVPTGNFGDILAGEFARLMGLPIGKLICASNSNDVLVDFFRNGTYDSRRTFYKTVSPSMDILVSSNLERLLFLRSGDDQWVKNLMDALSNDGVYDCGEIFEKIREGFWCDKCDEEQTIRTIADVFDTCGYVMDPHTAVGMHVYQNYLKETGDHTVSVLLSTASPYKFTDAVLRALGKDVPEDTFEQADLLFEVSGMAIPEPLTQLRGAEILHKTVCEKQDMGDAVKAIVD
ncbi:MAG: threonine synthase [Clostridia bacterium]|nr:threonine synthase [Clostridia bacterium]